MASSILQWNQRSSPILSYLPLVSHPAIKAEEYTRNGALLLTRTITSMALSIIASVALYWIYPAAALWIIPLPLSPLLGLVEWWRAERAADKLAVEEYAKWFPSAKATDRICQSPRAFQALLDKKENLTKLDTQGISLAAKLFSSEGSQSEKVRHLLVAADVDLLARGRTGIGVSLFMRAVRTYNRKALGSIPNDEDNLLKSILDARKVQAAHFSEQEQAQIWKKANNPHTLKLLCEHQFNLNARDQRGSTPLIYWAQTGNYQMIKAALEANANPLFQNFQGQKASDVARGLDKILLLQAEREFGVQPPTLPNESKLTAWFPWRSAARNGSVSVSAVLKRVCIIAMAAFALLSLFPNSLIAAATINVFTVAELWRGDKEVERQAVIEYLTKPVPSSQARSTLCKSLSAAQLLVSYASQPRFLNKLDETGDALLSNTRIKPEVFKLLVEKGADILAGIGTPLPRCGFSCAVKRESPDLLAYILDRRLVNIQTLPIEFQIEMWRRVGCEQNARLLRQYGFDPNVRDVEGNTPLIRLFQERRGLGRDPIDQMRFLLAAGADPHLQNEAGQTARDLAANLGIENLLI